MPIQFTQSCPTCGRRVQLRADLLGATVACQHCTAEFIARAGGDDPVRSRRGGAALSIDCSHDVPIDPLMDRVEKALARVESPTIIN